MKIDNLNIALPDGFEGRAHRIVDIVGQVLASRQQQGGGQISNLSDVNISISRSASNQEIGRNIANSIQTQIFHNGGGSST